MTDLRYPVGEFLFPEHVSPDDRQHAIAEVAAAPGHLRAAVADLTNSQLDIPYRPDGWTVRQVVHHLPDSHLNAYIRLKLALTEPVPTIRPYDQDGWATLPDTSGPIGFSLDLLDGLHARWVYLFHRLSEPEWSRTLEHPEWGSIRVDQLLAHYAWHGRHHVAHVTSLRGREGW